MAFWKIVALTCTASIIVDALTLTQKREIPANLCDTVFNNTNKVQCYCVKDKKNDPLAIKSADCFLTIQNVPDDDPVWSTFKTLGAIERLILSNTKGIPLPYVPTQALKEIPNILRLDIKYGTINTVGAFAFANISSLKEITLQDNQISTLGPYSFIHHKDLQIISLDTNNIAEINRNVFVDLPALEKLYLTNNKINTIHDRAFLHLVNLKELEIDRNKVFSLNYAVFEGLKNLEKLDISSNSLEVIGDNTFQALQNLKSLNLDGNKIQMLDDKAFNGLDKLISLTLAHNKLVYIDSSKVFEGLLSLVSLSLKGNKIKEFKSTAIEPILSNFYGSNGSLNVEDNNFPCDCHLDWFISLMNKTENKLLKITIENLKCTPSEKLRESWTKAQELEKTTPQAEEEEAQGQGGDYEYYDDTQLNGTLFYIDVRDLLNCSTTVITNSAPVPTTVKTTVAIELENHEPGNLEGKDTSANEIVKSEKNKRENQGAITTTRLATVSAKPEENKIYENMASDEAKPEKGKARSIHEEIKSSANIEDPNTNSADKNLGCVTLLLFTLLYLRFNI